MEDFDKIFDTFWSELEESKYQSKCDIKERVEPQVYDRVPKMPGKMGDKMKSPTRSSSCSDPPCDRTFNKPKLRHTKSDNYCEFLGPADTLSNFETIFKSKIWRSTDKLFSDLLDDLDNISADTPSMHRRKKARELFSDWLFQGKDAVSAMAEVEQKRKNRKSFTDFLHHRDSGDFSEDHSKCRRSSIPAKFDWLNEDETDSGYQTESSVPSKSQAVSKPSPGERTLTRENLRRSIEAFNHNQHGLSMALGAEGGITFQGFIRVMLNLMRPINMSTSTRPPSIYEVLTCKNESGTGSSTYDPEDGEITSFYLPKNTTKVIHISSYTTTQEVISALLNKYRITDNPRKFALYEQSGYQGKKPTMRRLADDEQPLPLCLTWTEEGVEGLDEKRFVLQENDAGEILWEAFSIPELENFRKILDREEAEYIDQVKAKYQLMKIQLKQQLKEMDAERLAQASKDTRQPVFV